MRLQDVYAIDAPVGALLYPSRLVRRSGRDGNYYLEDTMGFASDADIFPALTLPKSSSSFVQILTPSGVHMISKFSLVSCSRSR